MKDITNIPPLYPPWKTFVTATCRAQTWQASPGEVKKRYKTSVILRIPLSVIGPIAPGHATHAYKTNVKPSSLGFRVARLAFNQQRQQCILARQEPSENDVCISMRYVFSMCDEHCLGVWFKVGAFSLDRGRARAT